MKTNITSKLILVSIFVQFVNFGIYPLLAYYYNSHDVGEIRFYTTVLNYLVLVFTFSGDRFVYKINNDTALAAFKTILIVTLVFSLFFIVYNFFVENYYLLSIFFCLPFFVLSILIYHYLSSIKQYESMISHKFYDSIPSQAVKLLLIFNKAELFFLILAESLSKLFVLSKFKKHFLLLMSYNALNLTELFKSIKSYLIYTYPGMLLNSLSNILPILLIPYFFDYKVLGFYALSFSLINTPLGIISSNLSTIIQSKFENTDKFLFYLVRLFLLIFFIYSVGVIFFYFNAEFLEQYFFTAEWEGLGIILLPMYIMSISFAIVSPFSVLFHLNNQQSLLFKFQILKFFIRLSVIIYFGNNYDFFEFLLWFVTFNLMLQLIQIIVLMYVVKFNIEMLYCNYRSLFMYVCLSLILFFSYLYTNIIFSTILLVAILIYYCFCFSRIEDAV